jgi:L,D-transpeptidase catalytic domain
MTRWPIALLVGMSLVGCTTTDELEYGSETSDLDIDAFVVPTLPAAERAEIVGRYDRLDPTDKVPRGLLEDAIVYYDMNLALIPKPKYFVVTDMSQYSGKDRYWLVDVTSGAVEAHKVAHGDGSDADNNGYATTFGNVDGSHKTSLGFYLTGEIYDGTHVHSMRLDGLSKDGSVNGMANTNARSRLIVMHEASYVDDGNTSQQGRSNGCLALDPSIEVQMVDRIHDGTLIYVATAPLNPPVGRGGVMDPDPIAGENNDLDENTATGGCSTCGDGAGLLITLALVGLRRRRR